MKEYLKASLRDADIFISDYLLGYRVSWTVIHYWERRFDRDVIESLVKHIGRVLADSWYEEFIRRVYRYNYKPVIKPNV